MRALTSLAVSLRVQASAHYLRQCYDAEGKKRNEGKTLAVPDYQQVDHLGPP